MTDPAPSIPDGTRPRHAVCPACGYGLAGIELRRPEAINPVVFRAIGLIVGLGVVAFLVFVATR